jgi:hypothetical protein
MRPNDEFDDEATSPALIWAGGAAVTTGIILVLAAAQVAG